MLASLWFVLRGSAMQCSVSRRSELIVVEKAVHVKRSCESCFPMISTRLKEERNRLGWNQEKMAELVGSSRRSLVDWESEESTALPKAEQLEKLAQHGVDVYYVLTGQRIGLATTLSARESALVENYRAAPEEAKKALETTSAALAQSPGALKRAG